MNVTLDAVEVRVLGALVEKEMTTPEYYPLTVNALIAACNQKSNRHPVTSFDETTVLAALDRLREKELAWTTTSEGRVPKIKHRLAYAFSLSAAELAVLCELMLRGPQTLGELRGHAQRLFPFKELNDVEMTLHCLINRDEPLVVKLPRQPGQKESRYAHLLSGEPSFDKEERLTGAEAVRTAVLVDDDRIIKLEHEIQALRRALEELTEQLNDFRRQLNEEEPPA